MLFRGIKHQVDKGPVDWVTGKAKYTLNDNRLLREDLEYRTLVRADHGPIRKKHPARTSPGRFFPIYILFLRLFPFLASGPFQAQYR